ncbi:MAG: signal peptidase I, partial [Planctomycetota bacterium]|nr:signal peptidase I [Planctomycetota bacterium]
MRSAVVRTLWGLAGALLVVLLVKSFFADVYRVDSGSMRPTIFGGRDPRGGDPLDEHVVVRYGGAEDPERFDLVVIARPGSDAPMVKRVAGVPGERVQITDGDLMIDGARLPPEALRPAPIAVFDDRWLDVADYFFFASGPDGPWKREEDSETAETEWLLDATGIAPMKDAGLMLFHKDLRDG